MCNALVKNPSFFFCYLCTDRQSICWCCVVIIQEEKSTSMFDILRHLIRGKQLVSRLVLISFTCHLIQFSALPAGPLLVNSGKPYGAITYSGAQLSLDTRDRSNFNNSTVHCVMSTPNATATNIGGRPRPKSINDSKINETPSYTKFYE